MRKIIATAFAGTIAGLALLFAPTAQGAPTHTASVCDTGYRGQKAYDKACLTHGTVGDAAHLWYVTPAGRKGSEHDDAMNRRSVCKFAYLHGGLAADVRDLMTDVTYDSYRNDRQVRSWIVDIAKVDCRSMGYRV
jgi:hypothetical protein